ncbi:V-type proton ATPase subunit C 1-A [Scleropages formosus]|uniref:V-type proton ATPase subunit C 1-A n=1 Tax=Scleropages formosus TaxID=113540 RepID=UPI0010FACD77|nr:V-type proton ATPase subunit C 2 [Scleropages formosus]
MAEFWLVAAPLDESSLQAMGTLIRATSCTGLVSSFRFPIPELKVGTLDVLLGLSDDLSHLDSLAESVICRMAQSLLEVTEQSRDKVLENALANRVDPVSYVTHFRWDRAKYPTSLPLKGLTELISKQMSQVQTELKSRGAAYANLKASLQKVECRAEHSLQTRTLTDIVKKEDLVLDSEYLTTLLVVVPRERFLQWNESYESLSEFVVPRSSRKVLDEAEGGIFTVTLFKKAVVDFKAAAKQNSFAVRDFAFADLERQQQESLRLAAEMKEQHATFVLWLKVNFSEIFAASIHVKAIRVFVESVLRYGLPVNFQALLLQPDKKSSKKLRALLNSLFAHLDPSAAATKADARVDIPGLSMAPPDYYSYICYKIDISMVAS